MVLIERIGTGSLVLSAFIGTKHAESMLTDGVWEACRLPVRSDVPAVRMEIGEHEYWLVQYDDMLGVRLQGQ